MQNLIEVANQEGIIIKENSSLPERLLGLYYSDSEMLPTIYLAKEIYGCPQLERCVFAEELGHYYTTPPGDYLPRYMDSYRRKLTINNIELKACRKGDRMLISKADLLDAITTGMEEIWELAEHFNVTEKTMKRRLDGWLASGI